MGLISQIPISELDRRISSAAPIALPLAAISPSPLPPVAPPISEPPKKQNPPPSNFAPAIPCLICDSPFAWHSVYDRELRCPTCDPPPAPSLIGGEFAINDTAGPATAEHQPTWLPLAERNRRWEAWRAERDRRAATADLAGAVPSPMPTAADVAGVLTNADGSTSTTPGRPWSAYRRSQLIHGKTSSRLIVDGQPIAYPVVGSWLEQTAAGLIRVHWQLDFVAGRDPTTDDRRTMRRVRFAHEGDEAAMMAAKDTALVEWVEPELGNMSGAGDTGEA